MKQINYIYPLMLVLFVSCTSKNPDFLGLKTDEVLTHSIIKKSLNDAPMLASELKPFYEINYPNLNFSNVGVALTEFGPKDIEDGFSIENNSKIWGYVFFNRDSKKRACTEEDFEKFLKELKINSSFTVIKERTSSEYSKGFYRWNTYYKDGIIYTVICEEDTTAVKVLNYNVLLKYSSNDKTKEFFKKVLDDMEQMSKRKL